MTDIAPNGLALHSNHPMNSFGSSRHVGYIVHGQNEVKVAHKCDAFDSADAAPLTQERECLHFPPPPLPLAPLARLPEPSCHVCSLFNTGGVEMIPF